jgi:hypothetical protein
MSGRNKKSFFRAVLFFCLYLSGSLNSFSQEYIAESRLDTSSIRIGEQTKLHLSIRYKADKQGLKIQWTVLKDNIIKQIEIVSQSKIDTSVADKNDLTTFIQSRTYLITSFDSGYFAIPPFRFIINDSEKVAETEPLLLQVNTLAVDTTKSIMDIKAPYDEPFQWSEIIPYVLWSVAILAAIGVIIYLILRYKKKKPVIPVVEKKKPEAHIRALEELEKLKEQKLWEQGKVKQYHSAISDILRIYIEDRYKINALEQTTHEILHSFRSSVIDKESLEKLKQVLILADLVKFAKEEPLPYENENSLRLAFDFVNGTKRDYEELLNKTEIKPDNI